MVMIGWLRILAGNSLTRRRTMTRAASVELLEIRLVPAASTVAASLTVATSAPESEASDALIPGWSGPVKSRGTAHTVTLNPLDPDSPGFDPSLPLWIVIHGRNQSADDAELQSLATVRAEADAGDEPVNVGMLDWSSAAESGQIGADGEAWIKPVAKWVAKSLKQSGYSATNVHLIGYSWGADVAGEIAQKLKQVGSILAIDPARDHPLGKHYNPEKKGELNFARNSLNSWAFFQTTDNLFGSASTAATAHSAFVVTGSDHFDVMLVVTDLLSRSSDDPLSPFFSFDTLSNPATSSLWTANSYDSSGEMSATDAPFEAVLDATLEGTAVLQLRYAVDGEEVIVSG